MNRSTFAASLFGLSLLSLAAGCTVEERTVVRGPRPADRVEVVTVSPGPAHVWVRGRWEATGDGWEWIPGHWVRR